MKPWVPTAKKAVVSLFVILNLAAILYANRPAWAERSVGRILEGSVSPQIAYRVRYSGWLTARYGHLVGLDNRWQMFGAQSRFNWWLRFRARSVDGRFTDLPLPMQSSRSFLDRVFFDFREAKYYLNLYASQELQRRFARYLCRQFPVIDGSATMAIEMIRQHQPLLERDNADVRGFHSESQVFSESVFEEPCPARSR